MLVREYGDFKQKVIENGSIMGRNKLLRSRNDRFYAC